MSLDEIHIQLGSHIFPQPQRAQHKVSQPNLIGMLQMSMPFSKSSPSCAHSSLPKIDTIRMDALLSCLLPLRQVPGKQSLSSPYTAKLTFLVLEPVL